MLTKFILTPFLFFIVISVFSQSKEVSYFIDTLNQRQQLGFSNDADSNVTLIYETITEKQFKGFKKKYNWGIDTSSKNAFYSDTSFTLKTDAPSRIYVSNKLYLYSYVGYQKSLNFFIVDYVSAPSAIEVLFLVDKKTATEYELASPFDNGMGLPLISPKGNFLLSVSNNVFTKNEAGIVLLAIKKNNTSFTLENYYDVTLNKWIILDAVWVDENCFALSTSEGCQKITWKK